MKILTCNIRCFGAKDGMNDWVYRKELFIDVIRSQTPDIICFQEMCKQQFDDVLSELHGYQSHAMTDAPVGEHPQNCILYRRDAYKLISAGGYWLSEWPHIAGTKSWNSTCVRLAIWVRLEDRATETEFRVVNTHLDHVSQAARENQARLIVEDSSAYPQDYPQILTGDMNCDTGNAAIDMFKSGGWIDTYGKVHGTENPGHTFHRFIGPKFDSRIGKMDWIFSKGKVQIIDATVIMDSDGDRFPSDHYSVSATINME